MTSWKNEQVFIVGGGLGGLTAALAFARQGIASQVIEQAAADDENLLVFPGGHGLTQLANLPIPGW